MAIVTKKIEFNTKKSVFVDVDNFSSFFKYVEKFCKIIIIKGYCNDNVEFFFESLDELINYENPKFRYLKTIEIIAKDDEI